jgi:hypothetical protein
VGGVKKCFLGLRQTALLSAEGKKSQFSLLCVFVRLLMSCSGWLSGYRRCLTRRWPGFDIQSCPYLQLVCRSWFLSVTLRLGARCKHCKVE